jgi:hypothetical protein
LGWEFALSLGFGRFWVVCFGSSGNVALVCRSQSQIRAPFWVMLLWNVVRPMYWFRCLESGICIFLVCRTIVLAPICLFITPFQQLIFCWCIPRFTLCHYHFNMVKCILYSYHLSSHSTWNWLVNR